LIKESGFKVGDIITDKSTYSVRTAKIANFKLITKENFNKTSTVNVAYYKKVNTSFLAICYSSNSVPANYCSKKEIFKILTLGSSNIKIKISKSKIEATGREFNISWIKAVLGNMKGGFCGDFAYYCPKITIGCSTFTLAELEQVIETYNELNK